MVLSQGLGLIRFSASSWGFSGAAMVPGICRECLRPHGTRRNHLRRCGCHAGVRGRRGVVPAGTARGPQRRSADRIAKRLKRQARASRRAAAERSGATGPRERRRPGPPARVLCALGGGGGSGGAKPPGLVREVRRRRAPPEPAERGDGAPRATAMGGPAGDSPPVRKRAEERGRLSGSLHLVPSAAPLKAFSAVVPIVAPSTVDSGWNHCLPPQVGSCFISLSTVRRTDFAATRNACPSSTN